MCRINIHERAHGFLDSHSESMDPDLDEQYTGNHTMHKVELSGDVGENNGNTCDKGASYLLMADAS